MLRRICKLLGFDTDDFSAADKKIIFAQGNTVPTDATSGYAVGCMFLHRDGGEGTAFYINEGTESSCDFNAMATMTAAQEALLGATAGTVTASLAVIVDANKDIGDFRNLDVVNLDAGVSGTAGTVDIFAGTASKGKLILSCDDQTGDTTVTLKANDMGQATVMNIPDPGAAAAYLVESTAALTLAEVDVLDDAVAGTVVASKAVVADANKDIGDFRNLDAANIDAGASGTAGTLDIFAGTASKGKLAVAVTDQAGDTTVSLTVAEMAAARAIHLPDPGKTAYLMSASAAITPAEADVLDGATAGTQVAGKAVVANADVNTGVSKVTALHIGATGSETQVTATAAELNTVDITAAGTVEASKAVVVDGNKDIGDFRNLDVDGALSYCAGAAAAAVAARFGASATEGLEIKIIDEVVTLTNTVETDLTETVPSGAVIISSQVNLESLVVGDASGDDGLTKVGLGVTGDPDKYGLTADLLQNTKANTISDWAVLGGAETVTVKAADNAGAAVTEKFVAGGTVRVRIVYLACNGLDDA